MWHIICGIIQTQNQSAMYFTDVPGRSALIIPFRWSVLACSRPSARDLDLAILQNAAKTRAIPVRDHRTPFRGQYDELKASTVELTLEERLLRLYDCGIWVSP
jgi:hypothetical protein